MSQMPVQHGDPAYYFSTFGVRALDPAVHQVRPYPRRAGKRRPDEVRCYRPGAQRPSRYSEDDDMTELTHNNIDSHDWASRGHLKFWQANKLPPGLERSEAIRKAVQLRVAAAMKTGWRRNESAGECINSRTGDPCQQDCEPLAEIDHSKFPRSKFRKLSNLDQCPAPHGRNVSHHRPVRGNFRC